MIADKIIPSFYIIEITGDAIKTVIPQDYGIHKISLGSHDFRSDLHANEKVDKAINFLVENTGGLEKYKTLVDINPEFLPSQTEIVKDSDSDEDDMSEMVDKLSSQLINENKVAIAITKSFDVLGDFVVSRKLLSSESSKIEARVIANVDEYVKIKSFDQYQKTLSLSQSPIINKSKVEIH